jgi:hypothetical protein
LRITVFQSLILTSRSTAAIVKGTVLVVNNEMKGNIVGGTQNYCTGI